MSDRVFALLALLMVLAGAAMSIGYAGTYSAYAPYRDGVHTTGTVVRTEPHRRYVTLEVEYRYEGKKEHTKAYPPTAEAASFPVGASIDLLACRRGAIRPNRLESLAPPLALLVGAIASFALAVACVVLQLKLAVGIARPSEPLDLIVVSVARTRNVRLAGAILFFLFGVLFALVPLADDEGGVGQIVGLEVLAAITLALAAWLGAVAYRLRDPRRNPIVELVTERPGEIAWVYEQVTRGRGGVTVLTAILKKADGKSVDIRLTQADAGPVLAEIARRAPHAARGFSPEIEKQYRENPARWRPR
jgi:hypothetical protein